MKRLVILGLLSAFAVLGVAAVGCQTYDFQVVSQGTLSQTEETFPLKPPLKPNLWLLVDRSGSMATPDACSAGGGSCQTRLQALQSAMSTFLANSGTVARMALTFFPSDNSCGPANEGAVSLPTPTPDDLNHDQALRDNATQINSKIGGIGAVGGTPTAQSVAFVGGQGGLLEDDGRDDFILLLTDGLPNCNPDNIYGLCGCAGSNSCTTDQVARCHCTNASGKCNTPSSCPGCLDQAGAASQIAALKVKGIRTLVLGFGPDITNGDAPQTLAAMATAGGGNFRTCKSDSDCGSGEKPGECVVATAGNLGLCRRQYYKASNATELGQMLAQISGSLRVDPCSFPLTQGLPDSAKTIAVLINGEDVRPGPDTWTYSGNSVVFAPTSQYCIDIKAQKPGMTLKVRYVSTL